MLAQVGVDIQQLQHLPVPELLKISEAHLKKSYSVKVLGVRDGEIGVLSKRIEMRNLKQQRSKDNSTLAQLLSPEVHPKRLVTNYFYPKSLKATKKQIDPRNEIFREKLQMWQAKQYEKINGSKCLSLRLEDDQSLNSSRSQSTQPIFITNDALPSKNLTLPSVKRQKIGQNRSRIYHQDIVKINKEFPSPPNNYEKPSYSRLLSNLNETDIDLAKSQVLKIETHHNFQTPPKLSPKAGGVIYELEEEENEQSAKPKLKLPPIQKKVFDFSPDQILTKRLKKIQVKYNITEPNS